MLARRTKARRCDSRMESPRICATSNRVISSVVVTLLALAFSAVPASAQGDVPQTLDVSVPPGANYDKAEFRLWVPAGATRVDATVVLVSGSNDDGRGDVLDPVWQTFAAAHNLALVGCNLTDKPHDEGWIEAYVNVSRGSGQALLDALSELATRSHHPELAKAPLLMWGMSAGGQFNYEMVAWKPERVMAFVVNKGGVYYSALLSHAAREVPGMLFVGGQDMWSRTAVITGLFATNRRAGALWALAVEPSAGHIYGKSRDVALLFFEDVLALRLDRARPGAMRAVAERDGFVGDLEAKTFARAAGGPVNERTAWLAGERVARGWQAMVTGQPVGR